MRKKTERIGSLSKAERHLWSSKVKEGIELASITITIVVTGQVDNKER